jgi:hypothetical protein
MIDIIKSKWDDRTPFTIWDKGLFVIQGFSYEPDSDLMMIVTNLYDDQITTMTVEYFYYLIVDTSCWVEPIYDIDIAKLVLAHHDIFDGKENEAIKPGGVNYKNFSKFKDLIAKFYKPENIIYPEDYTAHQTWS